MSSTKKNTGFPGFEVDPDTGKYFPAPVNFASLFSESETKRQAKDWNNLRKCNDTHSIQPTKFRKTENGVRKELFKPPLKQNEKKKDISSKNTEKNNHIKATGVRKSLIRSLAFKNGLKRPAAKKSEHNESLHMIPITEEVEESIQEPSKNQDYPFKSPVTQHISLDDVKTPDSMESNANFLRLEELCQNSTILNESPVTTVCNMFENNMLLNSQKKNVNIQPHNNKEIISEIRQTVVASQELYQETSSRIREILELQAKQDENLRKITTLLNKLDDNSRDSSTKSENDDEKENSAIKRRSLRLQNKSPAKTRSQTPGSPVILKSGDLRKSTLTKSLVSKCQKYQIDSPRIQKAMDMYNSTRSVCNVLLTPKIFRGEFPGSPKSSNWRSNLSLKVQEQCLLLQDTPVHK